MDTSAGLSSRDKILDVAEALFARRGYAGVGLRLVASQAGLGKSSLFHHFRGKAQLYLAVLERVLARIHERLEPALARPGTVFERLDACIDALIDALAEQPTSARLLLRGLFEDDDLPEDSAPQLHAVESSIARMLGRVRELLREGVVAGSFRRVSVAHTLQTIIGATVYHFASGDFGEELIGCSPFSREAVSLRKQEVKAMLRSGLVLQPALEAASAATGGES